MDTLNPIACTQLNCMFPDESGILAVTPSSFPNLICWYNCSEVVIIEEFYIKLKEKIGRIRHIEAELSDENKSYSPTSNKIKNLSYKHFLEGGIGIHIKNQILSLTDSIETDDLFSLASIKNHVYTLNIYIDKTKYSLPVAVYKSQEVFLNAGEASQVFTELKTLKLVQSRQVLKISNFDPFNIEEMLQ